MDASQTLTSTQLLLIWTLLSFLFVWLVVFAILALRPTTRKQEAFEELSAPFAALPGGDQARRSVESAHPGAITPAPSRLHVIATPPSVGSIGQEAANEADTVRAR